jgi:hypothetical protein
MGRKVRHNVRLLEAAFSRAEWEYLKRNQEFKQLLKDENVTVTNFESIALLGDRLLLKWEIANPSKGKFRRVGDYSKKK